VRVQGRARRGRRAGRARSRAQERRFWTGWAGLRRGAHTRAGKLACRLSVYHPAGETPVAHATVTHAPTHRVSRPVRRVSNASCPVKPSSCPCEEGVARLRLGSCENGSRGRSERETPPRTVISLLSCVCVLDLRTGRDWGHADETHITQASPSWFDAVGVCDRILHTTGSYAQSSRSTMTRSARIGAECTPARGPAEALGARLPRRYHAARVGSTLTRERPWTVHIERGNTRAHAHPGGRVPRLAQCCAHGAPHRRTTPS